MKNLIADPEVRFPVLILLAVGALMILIAAVFGPLKFLLPWLAIPFLTVWVFIPFGVLVTLMCAVVGFFKARAAGISDTVPILFFGGGYAMWTLGLVLEIREYGSKPVASLLQIAGILVTGVPGAPSFIAELKKRRSRLRN